MAGSSWCRLLLLSFFLLTLAAGARADLTNPSTLIINEIAASQFSMELTLPVINGQVLKARPILPDVCVVEGEPEIRGDATKAIRTWQMTCDRDELVGAPVGIQGLLGTALDVLLTVEMLDGRQYSESLRATQAFFVFPAPPTLGELALDAGRSGAQRLLQNPELALLILLVLLSGARGSALAMALLAFSLGQGFGQWLGGQRWMVMSTFLPHMAAAGTVFFVGVELLGRPVLRPGWWRPFLVPMLVLGFMYGAASPNTVPNMGLSNPEQGLFLMLFGLGALAGLLLLTLWAHLLRHTLTGLTREGRELWTRRVSYVAAVLAGGVLFYRGTAPYFGAEVVPAVPAVTLVFAAALALFCGREQGLRGLSLALLAAALFVVGIIVSFHGSLPLAALAVFALLALVGARILVKGRVPLLPDLLLAGTASLYHGFHAGKVLRADTVLPVANAAGLGVILVGVFFVCFRLESADGADRGPSLRMPGFVVLGLAGLWQLAEYGEWARGPVASDLAMGLARVPVLALVLLLATWLTWPRRRRFASDTDTRTPRTHWILLGLAFYLLPLGTLRMDIPFHSPDAPSAAEAGRVMSTLLTDTYLAFNLADEDAAFDRLARNLSQELVADVYLDSRRRLRAGTREGAEVRVRDVSVVEVDEATGTVGKAFTYPCQWVVTARVRHLQHIHNRQNVYSGELTLQIEDDGWKISALNLLSEERVILSWAQS